MTHDQVQTIINEAAKNLPGYLALILTKECMVDIEEFGMDVKWPDDLSLVDAEQIMGALQTAAEYCKTAAEHYQPPLHPWQIN